MKPFFRYNKWCWLLPALLWLSPAMAQVNWSVRATSTVLAIDETITVTYSLQNATSDSFVAPKFTNWQVVKGPVARTTILDENGVRTTLKEFQYLLKPLHTGACSIPAASIVWQGKTWQSNSLVVDVVSNATDAALARQENLPANGKDFTYDAYVLEPEEDIDAKTRKNAFLKIRLSKKQVYEGEPLVAEYLLFSRVSLQAQVAKRPGFNGFSSIDIMDKAVGEYDLESIGGKVYKVFQVRKVQLYPLQPGKISLEPFAIDASVSYRKVPVTTRLQDFDLYSPGNIAEHTLTLESDAPTVDVLPLPEKGKPDNFTGLVGQFALTATLSKNKLRFGEPAELIIKIAGEGMWSLMPTPKINWPAGLRVFEPSLTESLDSQMIPVKGERQWTYRFMADSAGQFVIPAISLNFFDAAATEYKETSAGQLQLEVESIPYSAVGNDYTLEEENSMPVTEFFSRYMPLVFLSLALVLLLFLFIRRRISLIKKQRQAEAWEDEMEWPQDVLVQVPKPAAPSSTTPVAADAQAIHIPETDDVRHAAMQCKAWLQQALPHDLNGTQGQLTGQQQQFIREFISRCDEWIYTPLAAEGDTKKLMQDFETIKAWIA